MGGLENAHIDSGDGECALVLHLYWWKRSDSWQLSTKLC